MQNHNQMTEFLKNTEMLLKSIISQRLLLISLDKSKSQYNEALRYKCEYLRNEMWTKQIDFTMAQFLINNYNSFEEMIPVNKQYCSRKTKLIAAKLEAIKYYCPLRTDQIDLHDGDIIRKCDANKQLCLNIL